MLWGEPDDIDTLGEGVVGESLRLTAFEPAFDSIEAALDSMAYLREKLFG
jgi:hypothetical protein